MSDFMYENNQFKDDLFIDENHLHEDNFVHHTPRLRPMLAKKRSFRRHLCDVGVLRNYMNKLQQDLSLVDKEINLKEYTIIYTKLKSTDCLHRQIMFETIRTTYLSGNNLLQ